jgi:hypothetical protein
MKLVLCFALLAVTSEAVAAGKTPAAKKAPAKKPKKSKKPSEPKKPPPFLCNTLPWEPILLTSRVARTGDLAVVSQDLLVRGRTPDPVPKGATSDGRLFVSFGAPGLPRSMRIEFAGLREGELAYPAHVAERTRALVYTQQPESDGACTVLGRDRESGVVIQVPKDLAVDPDTLLGVLHIEQTVPLGKLPNGGRDLVLRLASFGGKPVRMGPVQSKELPTLELCAHGQNVPLQGSPLHQATTPQQSLCVSYTK